MITVPPPAHQPDFDGHGIANLMASILEGLGEGGAAVAPCPALPPHELAGRRTVVLMVLDGLGDLFLDGRPDSFIARHRRARLTAGFPTTTTTSITTFLSGLTASEHALTGWFTWLRELGSVATVLPFMPRFGGATYEDLGVAPARILDAPPLAGRLTRASHCLMPDWIVDSAYTRTLGGTAHRHPHRGLEDFADGCLRLAADPEPKYVYAYWPTLDALCHQHGVTSTEVSDHFEALDAMVARVAAGLPGDAELVITADHGLIDTDPAHVLRPVDHPELAAMLALPPCGEPRAAFCYVHADAREAFIDYVARELSGIATAIPRRELLANGLFGPGTPHSELAHRVGDFLLLMHGNWIITDHAGPGPFPQVGVHGGLSADELYVPLAVAGAP